MSIPWGRVSWYTKGATLFLFFVVFAFGFQAGKQYSDISRDSATNIVYIHASSTMPLSATTSVDVVPKSTKTSASAAPKKENPPKVVAPTTPKPPVQTPPVVAQPPVQTPASNEIRMSAYITGYGWPDNTPPGGAVSDGVLHQTAGGVGTFNDPITVAVGHSIIGGKDILDYPAGTKFYMPYLRRYFIVEDTCGDGDTPQNGPCHIGYEGHVWLDIWVGGEGASESAVYKCQEAITDVHLVIQNPASNYAVTSGPVFNNGCSAQYGDTVVTI
jgi:hypothetical protein